jgi:hypothetical protein
VIPFRHEGFLQHRDARSAPVSLNGPGLFLVREQRLSSCTLPEYQCKASIRMSCPHDASATRLLISMMPMSDCQVTFGHARVALCINPACLKSGSTSPYRATIDALRRAVKPRQAAILEALYGLDGGGGQLQKDVAAQHNLTRARIYQIKEVRCAPQLNSKP